MSRSASLCLKRPNCMSTMARICSRPKEWNTTISSTRLMNSGRKCWLTTCITAAGAATFQGDIQVADDTSFSTNLQTIGSTGAIGKAAMTANTWFAFIQMPKNKRRYMRINYTVATGPFTAGTLDVEILKDIPLKPTV